MSEVLLLTIGSAIFAVTTAATIFAGGVSLGRISDRDRRERELTTKPIVPVVATAPIVDPGLAH